MHGEKDLISIVLAGGFGTRMLDAGINKPKGLFTKNETPIVELTAESLDKVTDDLFMITNKRFIGQYQEWLNSSPFKDKLQLVSNGIDVPEKRAGALGDLANIIKTMDLESKNADIIVAPSDTIINDPIENFVEFCRNQRDKFATIFEKKESTDEIKGRLGCGVIEEDRVVSFIEKPEDPPSLLAVIPFYYYPKEIVPHLFKYLEEGNNPDAPSNIIPWFIKNGVEVRAYITKSKAFDIGTPEDARKLNDLT